MDRYKKAKIYDAGGDPEKRWFVFYYFLDPETGKYRRFKIYVPDGILTAGGKRDKAHEIRKRIDGKLLHGFNPFALREKKYASITEALTFALSLKKDRTRKRTFYTYRYTVNSLIRFLKVRKLDQMPVDSFTGLTANEFTDWSKSVLKLKNATVNYRTMHLKTMFRLLIKRQWILYNPFDAVEKLPVEQPGIACFTNSELITMEKFLPVWNYDLYAVACLVFYCFIRPQEIVRLRIEHFNLKARAIYLPGDVSKNRKTEMVAIPDPLVPVLAKLDLDYPPDTYVFSRELRRGDREIAPTRIAGMWREFADRYNISKTIYVLKHTGVGMAIEAGINARDLQLQIRHASLEETQRYADRFKRHPSTQLTSNFPSLARLANTTADVHFPLPPHIYTPGLS